MFHLPSVNYAPAAMEANNVLLKGLEDGLTSYQSLSALITFNTHILRAICLFGWRST